MWCDIADDCNFTLTPLGSTYFIKVLISDSKRSSGQFFFLVTVEELEVFAMGSQNHFPE